MFSYGKQNFIIQDLKIEERLGLIKSSTKFTKFEQNTNFFIIAKALKQFKNEIDEFIGKIIN